LEFTPNKGWQNQLISFRLANNSACSAGKGRPRLKKRHIVSLFNLSSRGWKITPFDGIFPSYEIAIS